MSMDAICANCGEKYGDHGTSDDSCPNKPGKFELDTYVSSAKDIISCQLNVETPEEVGFSTGKKFYINKTPLKQLRKDAGRLEYCSYDCEECEYKEGSQECHSKSSASVFLLGSRKNRITKVIRPEQRYVCEDTPSVSGENIAIASASFAKDGLKLWDSQLFEVKFLHLTAIRQATPFSETCIHGRVLSLVAI